MIATALEFKLRRSFVVCVTGDNNARLKAMTNRGLVAQWVEAPRPKQRRPLPPDADQALIEERARQVALEEWENTLEAMQHSSHENMPPELMASKFEAFSDAASVRSIYAARMLGMFYLAGQGVEPSRDVGIEWLARAARGGDDVAVDALVLLARTASDYLQPETEVALGCRHAAP